MKSKFLKADRKVKIVNSDHEDLKTTKSADDDDIGGVDITSDAKVRFTIKAINNWTSSRAGHRYRNPIEVKVKGTKKYALEGIKK